MASLSPGEIAFVKRLSSLYQITAEYRLFPFRYRNFCHHKGLSRQITGQYVMRYEGPPRNEEHGPLAQRPRSHDERPTQRSEERELVTII